MSNKKVLVSKDDLVITWFSGQGGGGQHKDRHMTCCRIQHPESGAVGVATKSRSAKDNRAAAFMSMTKTFAFRRWLFEQLEQQRSGQTIEEKVDEAMRPKNLKIEVLENGQWKTVEKGGS